MTDDDFIDLMILNNVYPKKIKGIRRMQILQYKKVIQLPCSTRHLLEILNLTKNFLESQKVGTFLTQLPLLQPAHTKSQLITNKIQDLMELLKFV